MKITKFGHACLLVEEGEARILIDPGSYSTGQNEVKKLDAVLITHEHQDHLSPESLKVVLANNAAAVVYTNSAVGKIIEQAGMAYQPLEHGQSVEVKGVTIEGFGREHAVVYSAMPVAANTGYLIARKFFHPGDSYTVPPKPVQLLALPTGGPWWKMSEGIDYAKAVKPKACFPIHDGMYKESNAAFYFKWVSDLLTQDGIECRPLEAGGTLEIA